MALSLFKPQRIEQALADRQSKDVERAAAIHDVSKRVIAERTQAEKDFDAALAYQQRTWKEQEADHRNKMRLLLTETEALEKRKAEALSPIIERELAVHNKEGEQAARKAEQDRRDAEFDDKVRVYMARLDEIGDRENTATKKEAQQAIRQEGLDRQAQSIAAQSKSLGSAQNAFIVASAARTKEIDDMATSVATQKETNDEYRKTLDGIALEQKDEGIRLADLRKTLEQELERIKKTKHG